jgi:hypothetical protein
MTKQFLDFSASQKENNFNRWMSVVNWNAVFYKGKMLTENAFSPSV